MSSLTLFSPRISAGTPKSNVPKSGSTSRLRPFTCHIQLLISRYLFRFIAPFGLYKRYERPMQPVTGFGERQTCTREAFFIDRCRWRCVTAYHHASLDKNRTRLDWLSAIVVLVRTVTSNTYPSPHPGTHTQSEQHAHSALVCLVTLPLRERAGASSRGGVMARAHVWVFKDIPLVR